MKKLFITDLKIGDSIFGEVFAVRSFVKKASRNNKPYFDVELADNSGTIKAKIWSDDMSSCDVVQEGDVVCINGTIEDFNGAPQLKITNLSKTEKYDLGDLQSKSKNDIEKMWNDIENTISKIKNPHIKKLLDNIFTTDFIRLYKDAPAAFKIHHNYIGGLLEHSWEMLKMAEPLKTQYPRMNMDLVNSGIILHDVGKVEELKMETTITQSDKGKLLGHIYIGAEIVKLNAPKEMPEELLNEILHIILAHSGLKENGSPKVPMTAEAMAVFVIDYASFRLRVAYDHIEGETGDTRFTQYSPHLGTELYRSPYSNELENEDIPF